MAQKGAGEVSPNPMVGAVVERNGEILCEGYHRYFGGKHAEVEAIDAADEDLSGSTIYINLEPCSHSGKQPPCVNKIINAGIKKVVIGNHDPNPLVNGRGIKILKEKNIEVTSGVLEGECTRLNESFIKFITMRLPFVTLKIAQTIDGRIAADDGSSKWITSEKSRKLVHKIRAHSDVILVGVGTVLSDDPSLDVRLQNGRNPKRLILDTNLRIPLEAKVLNGKLAAETIIATSSPTTSKAEKILKKGAKIWQIPFSDKEINLLELLKKVAQNNFSSILVEGGSQIFSGFLKAQLADRISVFMAPKIVGSGLASFKNIGIKNINDSLLLEDLEFKKMGCDYFYSGLISYN